MTKTIKWHKFWDDILENSILDIEEYKSNFEKLLGEIKDVPAEEFYKLKERFIYDEKDREYERLDNFYAVNLEILYCFWKNDPNNQEEIINFPNPQIKKEFKWLKCEKIEENHVIFNIIPLVFSRDFLDSIKIKIDKIEDIIEVKYYLVLILLEYLDPVLNEAIKKVSIKRLLQNIQTQDEEYLFDPEINPWIWILLLNSKLFQNTNNNREVYIPYLFDKTYITYNILKSSLNFIKEDPFLEKLLEVVYEKKIIIKEKSSYFTKIFTFPIRFYRKIKFRFTHSLELSILLCISLIFIFSISIFLIYNYIKEINKEIKEIKSELYLKIENVINEDMKQLPNFIEIKNISKNEKKDKK